MPKAKLEKARPFGSFCRLSHKRNSKGFDHLNWPAAISMHEQFLSLQNPSWAHDRVRVERERFCADDDQWRGRDVSVSNLLEVVRRIRKGRSLRAVQLS